jgi:hypothetical protein
MTDSDLQQRQTDFAKAYRLTYEEYKKLVSCGMDFEQICICLELVKCQSHRSAFRASMETKIRNWLKGNSLSVRPLTPKEFELTKPSWPVRIVLPS